jgi:hypothetical protein
MIAFDETVGKCYPCKKALCKLQGAFKNKLELFNACFSGFVAHYFVLFL